MNGISKTGCVPSNLNTFRPFPRPKRQATGSWLTRNPYLVEQKRMLEETERMIVDTDKRLGDAVQGLRGLIVGFVSPSFPPHSLHFTVFLPSSYSLQIEFKADPVL